MPLFALNRQPRVEGPSSPNRTLCSDLDDDDTTITNLKASLYTFVASKHLSADPNEQAQLQRENLDYFKVYFLPASGPTGLITSGFEYTFFQNHLANRPTNKHKWFVAASTGALRNVALLSTICHYERTNIVDSKTERMLEQFCRNYYPEGGCHDTLWRLKEKTFKLILGLDDELDKDHLPNEQDILDAILNHPYYHLCIFVNALKNPAYAQASDVKLRRKFFKLSMRYAVTNQGLHRDLDRYCFYTGPTPPPFIREDDASTKLKYPRIRFVRLTKQNIYQVLHATTCIPFLSPPCKYIDGVGSGFFVDGAFTDVMINITIEDPAYPALMITDLVDSKLPRSAYDYIVKWKRHTADILNPMFNHCSVLLLDKTILQVFEDGALPSLSDYFNKQFNKDPQKRTNKFWTAYHTSVRHWPSELSIEVDSPDRKNNVSNRASSPSPSLSLTLQEEGSVSSDSSQPKRNSPRWPVFWK